MNGPNYIELLQLAAPETILVLAALAVLAVDLIAGRGLDVRTRFAIGGMFAGLGCAAATAWILVAPVPAHSAALGGLLAVDPLTQLVKIALLAMTVGTVLLSLDGDFTGHVGEYLSLILIATVGMMFLVSAEHLLMVFIALELTSLSLYILAAFNRRDPRSAEAALKYFLFGGMAAAFTLYGLSLLYGLAGALNFREIAAALTHRQPDPLLVVAMVTVVAGFGFKVAAAPFHLWAPDAYQGAPTTSAAFIASGSKVASFFILAKLMMLAFAGGEGSGAWRHFTPGWVPLLAIVSVLSMVLGNVAAIAQTNVKRLIAYSAIAHAGYALLAVLARSPDGFAALLYYTITYGLTTLGAFGVVAVVERAAGGSQLADFAGFSRRAPLVSFCMLIFMLSLAGIPPLAGFFGKFYVFTTTLRTGAPDLGLLWLVILAIAMSAVSLYYYLQVLKRIFVADPPPDAAPLNISPATLTVLCVLALGVLLLGCAPGLLVDRLLATLKLAGF
jgi:NADH-quinone oxidoreductase subunit N